MAATKFARVKDYYDAGLWTAAMCRNAVVKGWITAEEYYLITGKAVDDHE